MVRLLVTFATWIFLVMFVTFSPEVLRVFRLEEARVALLAPVPLLEALLDAAWMMARA